MKTADADFEVGMPVNSSYEGEMCASCRASVRPGTNFCEYCGTKVGMTSQPLLAPSNAPQMSYAQIMPQQQYVLARACEIPGCNEA